MFLTWVGTMVVAVWFVVSTMSVFHLCSGEKPLLRAYSPGDIMIGGLFPVHTTTNRSITPGPLSCNNYDVSAFLLTQVMIHTIEQINQEKLLPNITLGYDIYDSCSDVSIAIKAALQLLKNQSNAGSCLINDNRESVLPEPETKVVIGDRQSEVSVAVARVVALSSLPQISYSSTSEALSNKLKFPTFLRTIPSDKFQTLGITELVKHFNWKTVAIIGSDDEYGKYGSDSLQTLFKQNSICVEFTEILPADFKANSTRLAEVVTLINGSFAEAIIMFTNDMNVNVIMQKAVNNSLNRTWIASDAWSTSTKVSQIKNLPLAGQVFGFISKSKDVPGFINHINSNFSGTNNTFLNHFLREEKCSYSNTSSGSCINISSLVSYIDNASLYNTYLAVQVVYEGLQHLLQCDTHQCKRRNDFTAAELLMEIKKVNVTDDFNDTTVWFDTNGDPTLGYDILHWEVTESKTDFRPIGEYRPNSTGGNFSISPNFSGVQIVNVTFYNCSKTCEPGQELKLKRQDKICCYECSPCEGGFYSPGNGDKCQACSNRSYSSQQKDTCLNKTEDFLQWTDPVSIVLTIFGSLGIIVTIVFGVLFTIYLRTPIVKAVGGKLCFLELLSLLTCFCLTFTFIGKPTKSSCIAGLPVFGIAFCLCISCILSNLLQIFVGFSFQLSIGSWLKKLNQPVAVVIILFGIQLALFVSWLCLYPPRPMETTSDSILYNCDKASTGFFIAMTGYNAFLGLICLIFAFKGKKLPDLYKNAYLITISMLVFLTTWILFIQIYLSNYITKKSAIESGAILISSYSILCCHLAPKCYIMLFKKELNNENAITEYIRLYYEQNGMPVVNS